MRKLILFFISIIDICNCSAQEFGMHWISCHEAADTSQVWFRRTFVTQERPLTAKLTVASLGKVQVFINERNVSTGVLLPGGQADGKTIIQTTFDITRYLRPDSNTVAIWYAPIKLTSGKQLSACYYGEDHLGTRFSHISDGTWLCRPASGWIARGHEGFNNQTYIKEWKKATIDLSGWRGAFGADDKNRLALIINTGEVSYKRIKTLYPTKLENDSIGLKCTFGRAFNGWIRLTLRNARIGEKIHIGDFTYICNGATDEQACRRFTTDYQQEVYIWGDKFKSSQIQNIEGIEIQSLWQNGYQH